MKESRFSVEEGEPSQWLALSGDLISVLEEGTEPEPASTEQLMLEELVHSTSEVLNGHTWGQNEGRAVTERDVITVLTWRVNLNPAYFSKFSDNLIQCWKGVEGEGLWSPSTIRQTPSEL